jgi:hypothetical protein
MESVSENLATWQRVFRQGLLPQFTKKSMEAFYAALLRDDPRIITGATMAPPPLSCMEGEAVERCCPLCWLLLDGRKPYEVSVGPLDERFAKACFECDQLMGEPASARAFLNAVDEWDRETMRKNLMAEIEVHFARAPLRTQLASSVAVAQQVA